MIITAGAAGATKDPTTNNADTTAVARYMQTDKQNKDNNYLKNLTIFYNKMKIAIYGPMCSGKSTIASIIKEK